ncbi:beta-hydroxyacyl-ACP dehydratase [Blastopirellula sp. JC732]|uniref:Beta-hydroxyacyl-ACP dehydratase n=1 Tax=Blastopirellula sediminis TaxID=2894196 RepID=A0A9X1MRH1_9BACT|nr:3-hydroxyacyl-ACP dehydratase FabZ family protein [Blastopirellula sediminis]MCC9606443.1 beta-hydroxyacyl-ACP dehydratase [Blastopirellula sediminis]MCC9630259.1 beta-hydroxyacyl-ACP dehydratase [Blastopirellula sediminis]
MRFTLIDRITDLVPGERIIATKCLSLAEEYLEDHFPRFPVMPGVLMLEAMTQTSAWLIRATEDFAHSVVILQEARNVKYADFVEPGEVLTVTAEWVKQEGRLTSLKVKGTVAGNMAVSARLVLDRYNLGGDVQSGADRLAIRNLKDDFNVLYPEASRV